MIQIEPFGKKAQCYILSNSKGMKLSVTDYGARIVGIYLPAGEEGLRNVSLSCPSDTSYLELDSYVGATIVPVAGRISGAKAMISGRQYQFTENEPDRTLHGGTNTANEHYWRTVLDEGLNQVTFSLELPDGFNGFPGPVLVQAIYQLTEDNEIRVDYRARSEQDTLFNPTNHVYLNLTGDFNKDVGEHRLKIHSTRYAPLSENNLPTGILESVEGSPFDFREFAPFKQGFDSQHPQLVLAKGYDHPWLLELADFPVEVVSPDGSVRVQVATNQPAVVIYTYNYPQEKLAAYHGVFSLECQHLPNACNVDGFGSILLAANEDFLSQTVYRFDWIKE